jgi:UDP-N-acetylmuramoylalanine--D-glutamate ligase
MTLHGLVTDRDFTRDELLERRKLPVHIVGAASAEGVAVARLMAALGFSDIVLHDMRDRDVLRRAFRTTHGAWSRAGQDELWEAIRPLVERGRFGNDYLEGIQPGSTVVLSQGWYLEAANRLRIVESLPDDAWITSMTALYLVLAPGPVAAITGTTGKSTTVALVDHLLTVAGIDHRTAGNERSNRQFLAEIDELGPKTWTLLEISNRQLLQAPRAPQVAAITSFTPDHLEEHGGLAGYRAAKARLFARQAPSNLAIACADDAEALSIAETSPGTIVRCGTGSHGAPSVTWNGDTLVADGLPMLDERVDLATRADLTLPGAHNLRNAAVAVAVALACGASPDSIASGLRSFEGPALRVEHIANLDGIDVFSDLKATTPEATLAALDALADRPLRLIAGGDDKGLDYAGLASEIASRGIPTWLVPGSASDLLREHLTSGGAAVHDVDELEQALTSALEVSTSGDTVIVSPAAAGFWTSQLEGKPSLRALVRRRQRNIEEAPAR